MSFKVFFLFFLLWRPFCSAKQSDFSKIGRGSSKKYIHEMFLKSGNWPRRRCRLKVFLFLALVAILFSRAE